MINMITHKPKIRTMLQQNMKHIERFCRKNENRREKFLSKPDIMAPRADGIVAIDLFCPSGRSGRFGRVIETILMMHMLQNCFALSDGTLENAVFESCSSSSYIHPGFSGWQVQNTGALTKFRRLPAKTGTGEKIFAYVKECPGKAGLMMHGRNTADEAVISAPCSFTSGLFMPHDLLADGVNQLCP